MMEDRSRNSPATDFFVHINCLSDIEQYGNSSSCFTNNMNPSILLPYHTPYEVALSNIYFKKDFYPIIANDEDSSIQVVFYKLLKHSTPDSEGDNLIQTDDKEDKQSIPLKDKFEYSIIDKKIVDIIIPSINLTGDIPDLVKEYNRAAQTPLLIYDELNGKIGFQIFGSYLQSLLDKEPNFIDNDPSNNENLCFALKFSRIIANYLRY